MIRVAFITERYAMPRHPEDDMADEPYCKGTHECSLTFRELTEALQEFEDYTDDSATKQNDVFTDGDLVVESVYLLDSDRARYWKKAVRYVQG